MIKLTKEQLMVPVFEGRAHESFEHSEYGVFDVTAMREKIAEIGELVTIPLDAMLDFILENRVLDQDRMMALPEESWRTDPGIAIVTNRDEHGTPTVLSIDGHHRAVRRAFERMDDMQWWLVPLEKAIRPDYSLMQDARERGYDWGDPIVDGKIVRGG